MQLIITEALVIDIALDSQTVREALVLVIMHILLGIKFLEMLCLLIFFLTILTHICVKLTQGKQAVHCNILIKLNQNVHHDSLPVNVRFVWTFKLKFYHS